VSFFSYDMWTKNLVGTLRDMRHHMGIGTVLQGEYAWTNVRLPPTTDSKPSDKAYSEWEQWKRQQQQQRKAHHPNTQNAPMAASRRASYAHSVASDNGVALTSAGVASNQHSHPLPRRAGAPDGSGGQQDPHPLCRSLRVFAAWKA
jgi:hypothetical protein